MSKMQRGDFLKTTGAAVAGLTVAGLGAQTTEAARSQAGPDAVTIWLPGSPSKVDWSKDAIVQAIQTATNTTLNLIYYSWDHYTDQINTAIASGKLPDIIGVVDPTHITQVQRWIKDGVVAPFEGAVAKAAPNVIAEYTKNPTLNELKVNGKIYQQPVGWGDANFPNMGIIHLRADLLDKYGMAPPDTFDQYFAFAKAAIKHGQPGILFNGSGGIGPVINAFAGAYGLPMRGWVKAGGGYQYYAIQPGMKNALLLFRKMLTMGLVDPSVWALGGSSGDAQTRFTAGKGCSLIFNGGGFIGRFQNTMDLSHKGYREYLLPALTAGAGHRGYTTEPMFWGTSFIGNMPNNNPVAAARVINFLISSEGYKLTALGIKGRDYQEGNGKITLLNQRRALDGFPHGAGVDPTGPHPLAFEIVSWEPIQWQEFSILYGKAESFKSWYGRLTANQAKYQVPTYGLLITTKHWTKFQATGDDLINRTFLQIVKASSDKQASDLFDGLVKNWLALGGAQAQSEMSDALSAIYK